MNVVAFDCSFDYVQMVLYKGDKSNGEILFEKSGRELLKQMMEDQRWIGVLERGDRCSTEKTLKLFSNLLHREKLVPSDLDAILVISGPGSFTSLRVSAMIVKVLAYTQNIPLYAFSHFDLQRHFSRAFFDDDPSVKHFLLVHAIHKREFAYALVEKNQLYDDNYHLRPKLEKVSHLDRWLKNCLTQYDGQSIIVLGESGRWMFNLLKDFFKRCDDWKKQGYFFSESGGDLCIKKDGILKIRLLEEKDEFFKDDLAVKKLSLSLLILFVFQGSNSKNIHLDFHKVDVKDFCPDYMGGSWG